MKHRWLQITAPYISDFLSCDRRMHAKPGFLKSRWGAVLLSFEMKTADLEWPGSFDVCSRFGELKRINDRV